MLRFIPFCHAQGARDHIRLEPAISIRKEYPIAGGRARAHVAGMTLAQPAVRQRAHALHLHARVLRRQSLENLARSIRRSVIHNDDLKVHSTLRE